MSFIQILKIALSVLENLINSASFLLSTPIVMLLSELSVCE